MSQQMSLIAYPDGQLIENAAIYHLVKNKVSRVPNRVRSSMANMKVVVRVTTSINPPRSVIVGYTDDNSVFMGVAGKDRPTQEHEDITILRETRGPKHGEGLGMVIKKFMISGLLKNSPFSSMDVWAAFDSPEHFKQGVFRECTP
jgi:hypothetical protein